MEAISARFKALMSGPAETSLILRPLSRLSRLYEQDRETHFPDAPTSEVKIRPQQADINSARRIFHDIDHHADASDLGPLMIN